MDELAKNRRDYRKEVAAQAERLDALDDLQFYDTGQLLSSGAVRPGQPIRQSSVNQSIAYLGPDVTESRRRQIFPRKVYPFRGLRFEVSTGGGNGGNAGQGA